MDSCRVFEILPETAIEEPGPFLYFTRRASMAPKLRLHRYGAGALERIACGIIFSTFPHNPLRQLFYP